MAMLLTKSSALLAAKEARTPRPLGNLGIVPVPDRSTARGRAGGVTGTEMARVELKAMLTCG